MTRTSIILGDVEDVAKKNADIRCNGNLSEYIRNLILQDDKKIQFETKITKQINILQSLSFLFLGIFSILLSVNILVDIPAILQLSILLFSGVMLVILSVLTFKTKKRITKEGVKI